MDNRKKSTFMVMFAVASVWFGTHVGGGFATGNQTVQFFVGFGFPSFFLPFLAILLIGWCYYNAAVMAKNHKLYRYDELAEELYAPFSIVGKLFFDIAFTVLVAVGTGIAIAGSGSLLKQQFNLNYYVGIVLTGVIFFLLTIFGAGVVKKASTTITILILVCLSMLLIPGLISGTQGIADAFASRSIPEGKSLLGAVWSACQYVGLQTLAVGAVISASGDLNSTKKCMGMFIIGTIINGVMIALSAMMIIGYISGMEGEQLVLPILTIAKQLNIPAIEWAYTLILFLAFISTGVGIIFGLVTRLENVIFPSIDLSKRRMIISIVAMLISVLLSVFGLTKLVAVGYRWLGRVSIFALVIPLAVIAPIKNARFKREHQNIE